MKPVDRAEIMQAYFRMIWGNLHEYGVKREVYCRTHSVMTEHPYNGIHADLVDEDAPIDHIFETIELFKP